MGNSFLLSWFSLSTGKQDGRGSVCYTRANPLHHRDLILSFCGQGMLCSPCHFHPADPTQPRAGKEAKFPSVCVCKPASFPSQKAEQAAINYKEILSSCRRFATTPVSKANRYGVLGSLVPCTAAMPNPGPQILLQQIRDGEEGRFVIMRATAS